MDVVGIEICGSMGHWVVIIIASWFQCYRRGGCHHVSNIGSSSLLRCVMGSIPQKRRGGREDTTSWAMPLSSLVSRYLKRRVNVRRWLQLLHCRHVCFSNTNVTRSLLKDQTYESSMDNILVIQSNESQNCPRIFI